MKTKKYSIFSALLLLVASIANADTQSAVNEFETFKTQLNLSSDVGNTYLSFMQGKVKPALDSFKDEIVAAQNGGNYRAAILSLLAQGDGVAVRIDANNFISNVGYLTGENPDDVKSGRSFGVGPTNRQSDPSDIFYLTELQSFLSADQPDQNVETFYSGLMNALTDCNSSQWEKMTTDGQTVATDFMAIYTAESDRHIMVHLGVNAHPWENDLAGATIVSAVDVKSGKMINNGQVVEGPITGWWAKGQVGSGIGETRTDRKLLQVRISNFERSHHPELVSAIEKIVGQNANGDAIQGVMEFLNSPNAPASLGARAEALSDAVVKFIMQARSDADDIMAE